MPDTCPSDFGHTQKHVKFLTTDRQMNMWGSWLMTDTWTCNVADLKQTLENFNFGILRRVRQMNRLMSHMNVGYFLLGTDEGSSWLATDTWTYDWSCNLWNNYKWLTEITLFNTQSCIQFNFVLVGVLSDFWFH